MCGQRPKEPIGFRAANDSRWSRTFQRRTALERTTSLAARLGRVRGSQGEPHVRHVRAASAARCVIGRLHRRALERLRLKSPRSDRGEDHPRHEQGPRDPRAAEAALEPRPRARRRRPFEGRCGARTRVGHGDYSRRIRRYVRTRRVGENIAWTRGCSAQKIVNMWLNSAPHRHVMLSGSFRRIGVGKRGARKCFVTADFASASSSIQRRHARERYCARLPCGERSSIPSRRRWDAPCSAWSTSWPRRRPPTWPRIPTARGCSSMRA